MKDLTNGLLTFRATLPVERRQNDLKNQFSEWPPSFQTTQGQNTQSQLLHAIIFSYSRAALDAFPTSHNHSLAKHWQSQNAICESPSLQRRSSTLATSLFASKPPLDARCERTAIDSVSRSYINLKKNSTPTQILASPNSTHSTPRLPLKHQSLRYLKTSIPTITHAFRHHSKFNTNASTWTELLLQCQHYHNHACRNWPQLPPRLLHIV